MAVVAAVIPVVGTLFYADWRWGWKPDYLGLSSKPASLGWFAAGLAGGGLAAVAARVVSAFMAGVPLTPLVSPVPALSGADWLAILVILLPVFASELVFRAAVISRYQSDLTAREVLIAGTLTPFGWLIIAQFFRFSAPPNLLSAWDIPLLVFLALLYIRTDSVWLTTGIRVGMIAGMTLLAPGATQGALVVAGVAAVIMLLLEWFRKGRMPRRVEPRRTSRGRVYQGPWNGPH
jgi:hypothetical protein